MILFYLAGFFILAWLAFLPISRFCEFVDWDDAAEWSNVAGFMCALVSPLCGMAGFVYLIVKAV